MNTIADLFNDPHVLAREALVEIPMPDGRPGSMTLPNTPIRLSASPAQVGMPMPGYGEHTDEVLGDWLGMDTGRIAELRQAGVVG